jgi:hypothetical protein
MGDPLALNLVPFNSEPSLVFDAFDLDLVLKVLNNTAFSESLSNHPKLYAVQTAQLDIHLLQARSLHSLFPLCFSHRDKGSTWGLSSGALYGSLSSRPSVRRVKRLLRTNRF